MAKNDFKLSGGGGQKFSAPKVSFGGGGSSAQNQLQMLMARELMSRESERRKPALAGETTTAQQEARLGTRQLSHDERADLRVFDTINGYISDIESLMDTDPNRFQEAFAKATAPGANVLTMGDQDAINIQRALGDWSDLILRERSKSQTTEKEFSRIRSFGVPTFRDLTVTEDPTTGESYPTMRKLFSNIKDVAANGRQRIIQGIGYETGGRSPIPGMNQNQNSDPVQSILERRKQRKP